MAAGILSLEVQWLRLHAPNVGGPGLIPGQGTRSRLRRQRPCAAPKAWCCHTHTQKAGNLLSLLTLKSRSYFSAALYAGPGLWLFWPKEYSGSDAVPGSSLSLLEPSLHIVREPELGHLPRSLWKRSEALVATQAECSADGWLWEGADLRVTFFPVKPSQQTLHAARMTCPSLNPLAVVQSLICVWRFVIPWTEAHQTSLSFTISRSLLKLMSTESVMPSNHLILCHPLLLPPSIFPSIMVFSSESALCFRGPNIGALASASVLPMNIQG